MKTTERFGLSLWELGDWAFTIFSVILCLGGTALGLLEALAGAEKQSQVADGLVYRK